MVLLVDWVYRHLHTCWLWFMLKCFQLMIHVHIIMLIPINRNHQGREMCTSRTHNKFTWSGLMIYEMICVGDWLILYPYPLNFFYVLLPYPPSPISGNKFKMIGVSTCYFGVIISCVRYGLICFMQDNWNAFGEMKMLIFCSPEWTILKKVESTVCSTFSAAC